MQEKREQPRTRKRQTTALFGLATRGISWSGAVKWHLAPDMGWGKLALVY